MAFMPAPQLWNKFRQWIPRLAAGLIFASPIGNTANTFQFTDGTNAYYAIDTRTGITGVKANAFGNTAPSFASASGNSYSLVSLNAFTLTQTGTTTITALNGLSLDIGSPTVTNTSAGLTITTVSAVRVNGPLPSGNATFTNSVALDIPTFATNGTTASGLRVAAPTGAGTNWAVNVTSGNINASGLLVCSNGSKTAPSLVFANDTASGLFGSFSAVRYATGGVEVFRFGSASLVGTSAYTFGWVNTTDTTGITADTALARNAAGVVEVNNGTAGTFRDLVARTVSINSATIGTPGSLGSIYVPYDANAGASDAKAGNQNGAHEVNNADAKAYWRIAGAWKGVAIAGFSIPKYGNTAPVLNQPGPYRGDKDNFDETLCPCCHEPMQPGEPIALIGDRHYHDGGLHAYACHFGCAAQKLGYRRAV